MVAQGVRGLRTRCFTYCTRTATVEIQTHRHKERQNKQTHHWLPFRPSERQIKPTVDCTTRTETLGQTGRKKEERTKRCKREPSREECYETETQDRRCNALLHTSTVIHAQTATRTRISDRTHESHRISSLAEKDSTGGKTNEQRDTPATRTR